MSIFDIPQMSLEESNERIEFQLSHKLDTNCATYMADIINDLDGFEYYGEDADGYIYISGIWGMHVDSSYDPEEELNTMHWLEQEQWTSFFENMQSRVPTYETAS